VPGRAADEYDRQEEQDCDGEQGETYLSARMLVAGGVMIGRVPACAAGCGRVHVC
jgi:hypothetical protein